MTDVYVAIRTHKEWYEGSIIGVFKSEDDAYEACGDDMRFRAVVKTGLVEAGEGVVPGS